MPVVLVTGAARRVGAAIARSLADGGWQVVVHCRASVDEADALVAELNRQRADAARRVRADLGDGAQIAELADAALAAFGRLDGIVHNASSYYRTPLDRLDAGALDDLLAGNLRAPALLSAALAPRLEDGGSIVSVLDSQLSRAVPGYAAYSAAKAGLWQLTRSLARELAPRVRVNAVSPGHVLWAENGESDATQREAALDSVPMRRLGEPQEIGAAVRFLMSEQARYITGVNLPVDGGLSLV